jgi:hypothetical protein
MQAAIYWDYAMELTGHLVSAPIQALSNWPDWVGFAGIEWISDFAQVSVESVAPRGWSDLAKMGIRGGATDLRFEFASLRGYL